MTMITIGIVDYGFGNHASVYRTFLSLNYRCRVTQEQSLLSKCDVIVLPGVGAYPAAMSSLHSLCLVEFLRERSRSGQPIIGLCLGMQLLADVSLEHGITAGLGLIPGQVVPLESNQRHIGWNTIEVMNQDSLLLPSHGESVYFNHSYIFNTPMENQVCVSRLEHPFAVGVRSGNIVGVQFHPEKSQRAGRTILRNLVEGLTCA